MKKLLLILFFILALVVSPSVALAQTTTKTGDKAKVGKKIEAYKNALKVSEKAPSLENTSFFVNTGVLYTGLCLTVVSGACSDPSSGDRSALESASQAITMLYEPPATTGTYVADLLNSAGVAIAPPAYAQGLGFSALDPILETWKVLRNVAYLFYVIIFLVIGFAIMFRQKLNSQAAITAQQALPQIIISLIAVTFSYAIAGFLIDMMYLIMFLLISLFASMPGGPSMEKLSNISLDRNIFQVGFELLTNPRTGQLGNSFDAVQALVNNATNSMGSDVQSVLGFIGGLTFAVVFALATVFAVFKLFFELLKTYISIIISIVMSPLALMLGALPGNNAFSAWIKTLIANLLVFPAVMLILILFFLLTGDGQPDYGGFLPPYLIGRGSGDAIRVLLGLGVILILPDIVGQVKTVLGGKGGIFEQFANNFTAALDKGWKGGELIPGLAASNTNNLPILKQLGGGSGKNVMQKLGIGAAMAGGAVFGGLPRGIQKQRAGGPPVDETMWKWARAAGRRVADAADDKEVFTDERSERTNKKKKTKTYF